MLAVVGPDDESLSAVYEDDRLAQVVTSERDDPITFERDELERLSSVSWDEDHVVELDWSDDGTALRLAQRDDDASATYRLAGDRVVGFEDDERTIDAELARNGSFSALTLHGDRVRGGRHDELPSIGCRDVWPSRRQRGSCRARRNSVRPSWEPINERGPGITPASASDDGDGAQHRIRATWCPAIRAAGNGPRGTNRRLRTSSLLRHGLRPHRPRHPTTARPSATHRGQERSGGAAVRQPARRLSGDQDGRGVLPVRIASRRIAGDGRAGPLRATELGQMTAV